eukprot:CAMPEP_0179265874 /NCGR_PEP_ID=MMETSP0797-20121207/29127_1 /TAXON_ID=47934 /ORGANISM="Dinophysis acuminata, Strain DAEP01" /LENGTH=307 /DNA_ID=CAMNT_0020974093 /DNA_START=118 /DNA_END=1039 /DNA_ORIENTATION=+
MAKGGGVPPAPPAVPGRGPRARAPPPPRPAGRGSTGGSWTPWGPPTPSVHAAGRDARQVDVRPTLDHLVVEEEVLDVQLGDFVLVVEAEDDLRFDRADDVLAHLAEAVVEPGLRAVDRQLDAGVDLGVDPGELAAVHDVQRLDVRLQGELAAQAGQQRPQQREFPQRQLLAAVVHHLEVVREEAPGRLLLEELGDEGRQRADGVLVLQGAAHVLAADLAGAEQIGDAAPEPHVQGRGRGATGRLDIRWRGVPVGVRCRERAVGRVGGPAEGGPASRIAVRQSAALALGRMAIENAENQSKLRGSSLR